VRAMMPVHGSLRVVAEQWGAMTEDDKGTWNDRARKMRSGLGKKRFLTGYNCFVREHYRVLTDLSSPQDRMKKIGELWKSLSSQEKEGWKPI